MGGIAGIDPGLDGAVAVLSEDGKVLSSNVIPRLGKFVDIVELNRIFEAAIVGVDHVFLELVSAFPGQGVSSMFKFGRVFGLLEGLLGAKQIPYTLVTPQSWMKVIHQGLDRSQEPKTRSVIAATRLFPSVNFRRTERCSTPHLGLVDAVLIAEYGRRQRIGELHGQG